MFFSSRASFYHKILYYKFFYSFSSGFDFERNEIRMSSRYFLAKNTQFEVIKSRRRAARCRPSRSGNGWTKGLASRLKGSHPLLLPSLPSITIIYPLSPLLSFIITARDFIPALEAAGRPTRCAERERKRERGGGHGRTERDGKHNRLLAQRLL